MWWQRLKNLPCLASFLQAKHCLLLLPLLLNVDGQHYLVIPDPDIKTVYLRVGGESPAFDLVSEPQQQLEHHGLQDRSTEAFYARGEEGGAEEINLRNNSQQMARLHDCEHQKRRKMASIPFTQNLAAKENYKQGPYWCRRLNKRHTD